MMNRKLIIGILVTLGIVVTIINPLVSGIFAAGVWIYLVGVVRKQKNSVLNGRMTPILNEWHFNWLKTFLIVAGLSFPVFLVFAVAHNVLEEDSLSLIVALLALWVLVISTAGGLIMFLRGRQKEQLGN
jgi:hypothetical protein